MIFTSIKHINLKHTLTLLCLVLCFQVKSIAQDTKYYKTQKKDSVVDKSYSSKKQKDIKFNGSDGPYIINDTLYRVTSENEFLISPFFKKDSIVVQADNKDKNEFYVSLESNYTIPKTTYSLPGKMVVISDIEGNYDAFAAFLYINEVIDEDHNWIFNNGHLVLGGDFVDRGKNVTQVLWLIYKLEHQAKKQNGVVHFILGNHEILNFHGDHRYNRGKYIKAALSLSQLEDKKEAIKYLYSKHSELGKWLATKNVIEKIGPYLFVHAGLSPEILDYKLNLEDINKLVRSQFRGIKEPKDKTINFLYSVKGPFWYRGFAKPRFQYDKIKELQLEAILKYYDSEKVVIGHTSVKNISTKFDGKIIMTDVNHGNEKFTGKTKGILIENNKEFIIDDNTSKTPLKR